MLKNQSSILLIIFCLTIISIPSWALDFKPGKYEITSKMDMPGMPANTPPQTIIQCMTDQDTMPKVGPENQGCKIMDIKQTKTTVSWKMECDQNGQTMTSTGKMTYNGKTFKGTVATSLNINGKNMVMTTAITGKRLSDCE